MGLFNKQRVTARFGEKDVRCLICGGGEYWIKDIQLNTAGMELLDLGWANRSAMALICNACGYIHEFVGEALTLYEAPE
jgi:predicted nucleic-acid-binding Zn-ribbon protein